MKQEKKQNEQWKLLVLLLKEISDDKKIIEEEIAKKTGMQQSHISRFFQAKYKPSLPVFLEIAKAIKVNFFFEDQDGKTDLNKCFEKAMELLARRGKPFSNN